jgi:hypothetical protein
MHKFILTLSILASAAFANDLPKVATIAIPSNTVSAITSVALGDDYRYAKEIDAIKFTVTGKTDTNIVLVATIGQPIAGYTNTVTTQSFDSNTAATLVFPRNYISTNCVERFNMDIATLSCTYVWATNTAITTTMTNAVSISATITTK